MSITKLIPCPTCGYPLDETEQKGLAALTEQASAQGKWISNLDTKLTQAIDFLDDNGRAHLLAEWATPPKEAE